jgi:hypothetical protein
MLETDERRCVGCGDTEAEAHLERCTVCGKHFCPDCTFRQTGRRFCSGDCARAFFWEGMDDDDDEGDSTED